MTEKKKVQGFSLDPEVDDFIDKKKWDLKQNRSQIVNKAFKYFKENEKELDKIIKKED